MTRVHASFLVFAFLVAPPADHRAHAEETPLTPDADLTSSTSATRFLASTASAVVADSASVTAAWGGYDGAARTPTAAIGTELRLVRRVSLLAGVSYGSTNMSDAGLRPQLGVRVQFLEQRRAGVDASAAFLFRQDRFTTEDGLFQGAVALGRTFGETSAVLNIVYGQDGEGDDHQGELRLAGLRRVRGGLHLGVEARYMRSLASTDPHRAALGTPSMELMAGPLVAYTSGAWALMVEAGFAAQRTTQLQTGMTTLGGVGAVF